MCEFPPTPRLLADLRIIFLNTYFCQTVIQPSNELTHLFYYTFLNMKSGFFTTPSPSSHIIPQYKLSAC